MKKNKSKNILIIIVTTCVIVGAIYWLQNHKATLNTEVSNDKTESIEISAITTNLIETAINGTTIKQDYRVNQREKKFESLITGDIIYMDQKNINKLDLNSEDITSFYAPEHPSNSNIIFISTQVFDYESYGNKDPLLHKIYSYNIETNEFTKIHEIEINRTVRSVGMDGSKLILMYDKIENSPGPCFSIWSDWEEFGYLELSDIASGLKPYTVPEYQIELGKAEQEECEKGLEEWRKKNPQGY